MSHRVLSALALVAACALLSACGDAAIDTAKNAPIAGSDFTYGELFKNAKGCKSTKWTSEQDEDGRPIVQALCTTELSSEVLKKAEAANDRKAGELVKLLDETWHGALDSFESSRRNLVDGAASRERQSAHEMAQLNAALIEARAKHESALSAETSVRTDLAPNVTARLEEVARQRKIRDVGYAQREIDELLERLEKAKSLAQHPSQSARQTDSRGRTVADLDAALANMTAIKESYFQSMQNAEKELVRRSRAHEALLEDKSLQLRITFLVNSRSPVQVSSRGWLVDGEPWDGKSAMLGFAMLKPSLITEYADMAWAHLLIEPTTRTRLEQEFPFKCASDMPTGCVKQGPSN